MKVSFFGSTIRETVEALTPPPKRYKGVAATAPAPSSKKNTTVEHLPSPPTTRQPIIPPAESTSSKAKELPVTDVFENRSKVIMRIIVTLILLGVSIYLLVDKGTESKTLPCSIISAVTGYWLK